MGAPLGACAMHEGAKSPQDEKQMYCRRTHVVIGVS